MSDKSDDLQRIVVEKKEGIAKVFLNRPDKLNGLDMPMFEQLIATAKEIRKDRSIRVVILAGRGRSFCAGLDLPTVMKKPTNILKLMLKWPGRRMNMVQRSAYGWRDIPVPVISVLHGNCLGGGLQLALATDYRIAKSDTRLSLMEMKWGLIPDMSAMVTLPQITRLDIAQELTMTGRKFSAEQAYEYGLVSCLAEDPMAEAERLAALVAKQSPDAVAASKHLLNKAWQASAVWALRWERWTQWRLLGRRNQLRAVKNGTRKDQQPLPFSDRTSFR